MHRQDNNGNGFGHTSIGGRPPNSRGMVVTDRYEKQGEPWVVISSIGTPLVELRVPEDDIEDLEG